MLYLTLKGGDVTIELRHDLAPAHVQRIKDLVREGAYNNVAFHRVISGFMAQTGDVLYGNLENGYDPLSVGTGGSDKPDLPSEFSPAESFVRGTVGMARSQNPHSANSQFFITFEPSRFLDGQYTIVGHVVKGMEIVDKIKRGDDNAGGAVKDPDRIIKAWMASDS